MLKNHNDYITFLLEAFEVPETISYDSDDFDEVPRKKAKRTLATKSDDSGTDGDNVEREQTIKNKIAQKKVTRNHSKSERQKKKAQRLSVRRVIATPVVAAAHTKVKGVKVDPETADKNSNVYNKEERLFFSKFQNAGDKKRKGADTNPKLNLKKLRDQSTKIKELVQSEQKDKAKQEKDKILWKTAFDKTEGVKVKDDANILKKTIKNRKVMKKKSKETWKQRKSKLEEKQSGIQKKREDNINKRKTDNQKNKLKNAVKKGRIIKGVTG